MPHRKLGLFRGFVRGRWKSITFAATVALIAPAAFAAPVAVLHDGQSSLHLGHYLEVLEDPSQERTIDEVSRPALSQSFAPSEVPVPNLGFTDAAIWVRFTEW